MLTFTRSAKTGCAKLTRRPPCPCPKFRVGEVAPEHDPFVPETPEARKRAAKLQIENGAPKLSPDESKQFERLVKSRRLAPCHWGLLVAALILTALSIPLVYSASTAIALDQHHGDTNFFLWRQIGYSVVGLGLMLFASRIAPEKLRAFAWGLYAFALLGLLATKFSPLGYSMGNVERWVKLGPLTFQFSELAKIAVIGIMADFWSRAARMSQKSMAPWIATAALAGAPIALDFHPAAPVGGDWFCYCCLWPSRFSRARRPDISSRFLCRFWLVIALQQLACAKRTKCRLWRPTNKTASPPNSAATTPATTGATIINRCQGQRAIMRGGLTGVGLGASLYKQGHLPAPHTDFIFAVIAEETGAWGVALLLLLYGAIVFFCFQIGHSASNGFDSLLCVGIGTLWALQVLGNIAVVSGVMPVTGMPLPILTFGGSGLWCALFGLGLVLAVSRAQGES